MPKIVSDINGYKVYNDSGAIISQLGPLESSFNITINDNFTPTKDSIEAFEEYWHNNDPSNIIRTEERSVRSYKFKYDNGYSDQVLFYNNGRGTSDYEIYIRSVSNIGDYTKYLMKNNILKVKTFLNEVDFNATNGLRYPYVNTLIPSEVINSEQVRRNDESDDDSDDGIGFEFQGTYDQEWVQEIIRNKSQLKQPKNLEKQYIATQCPSCLEDRCDQILTCGHFLCSDCNPKITNRKCPLCRVNNLDNAIKLIPS